MYIPLLQTCLTVAIFFCCKSDQTLLVDVYTQGVEAGHTNVDSQVVLVPVDEMRVLDVFGDDEITPVVQSGVFVNDADTTPTRRRWGFDNPQPTAILIPVKLKPPEVLRQYICIGA